jgi:hypothetical protein
MRKSLIFAGCFIALFGCTKAQEKNKQNVQSANENTFIVDTILQKQFSLTSDGISAVVKYHIQVKSWDEPVLWSMIITSNDKSILTYSSLDTSIDSFFHDKGYLYDCSNYIKCKKKWYLDRIMKFYIDTIKVNDERRRNLQLETNEIVEQYFKEFSIEVRNSKVLYKNYWSKYSKGDIISFMFSFAPEGRRTPLITYYPEESIFIPIYFE